MVGVATQITSNAALASLAKSWIGPEQALAIYWYALIIKAVGDSHNIWSSARCGSFTALANSLRMFAVRDSEEAVMEDVTVLPAGVISFSFSELLK